jgi:DNA mismatch repair ATPase MutS
LFDDIRDFGCSRTYALMKGPVYPVNGDFLTRAEKPRFLPAFRFIPSSVKPIPSLLGVAGLAATMYFSDSLLAGAGHMKYAMLILMLPVIPMIFSSIATSDRDTIIYPLRKKFKSSPELARSLDALGLIDELLAFRRYAQAFGNDVVLPEIIDNERHCLQAQQVRNPVLGKGNSAYVPNQIPIDAAGERLLVITGPNSGGKTAYCKTVAQVQLLGQIGCYVPAEKARLVPAEHIFYQVPDPGRLDEKMGRFGHELKRTREIFFNATSRSLVVLDELGEGTTYEEKMEISEYILKGFHSLGASTLLVTHNHELCQRLHEEAMGQYLQVEFAEGKPTHRLISGVSKVSHADRVAAALGFSRDDVKKHLATRRIGEAA